MPDGLIRTRFKLFVIAAVCGRQPATEVAYSWVGEGFCGRQLATEDASSWVAEGFYGWQPATEVAYS